MGLSLYNPEREPPSPGHSPTVQEIIDWFLARKTSTSRVAITEFRRILSMFASRYGPVPVSELIGDDLIKFVEDQPGVKAGNTVARWYRTIKQPFNKARRLGKIHWSPFEGVELPKGEEGRDLTPLEFRTLLRLATASYRRVLIFLRFSGARPGELRELRWDNIVWNARGAVCVLKKHKTSATQKSQRPRRIVLATPLVKLLLWIKRRSTSDFVFVNHFGGKWQIGTLCKRLRTIREKAGFGPDVKQYGCRHFFGTQAILNGTDLMTLMELMGHTNPATTKRYIHLADKTDHLTDAVEKAIRRRTNRDN